MKRVSLVALLMAVVFFTAGCGTMIRGAAGTSTPVTVRTDPSNATVMIGGMEQKSPAVFTLEKKKNYQVIIKKEGYKSTIINLRSQVKGGDVGTSFVTNTLAWGWWTLGIGTAVGMITDASTGSMVDLDADGLYVKLEPGEGEKVIEASSLVPKSKSRKRDPEKAGEAVEAAAPAPSTQGTITSDTQAQPAEKQAPKDASRHNISNNNNFAK